MLRMTRTAHKETGLPNLCLAGGVALNCVGNGRLLREGPFENIWIQPAAGDAGGSLGVAQLIWHRHLAQPRTVTPGKDSMKGAYLGPGFTEPDIKKRLDRLGAKYELVEREALTQKVAALLADGKMIGWHNGRNEFGPRALGSRSIIGDPRSPAMQAKMNIKIKFRESFRPFAPSILEHKSAEYFDLDAESPYMLLVAPVRDERRISVSEEQEELFGIEKLNVPRSEIPAVTHVDYSARVQTVHPDDNRLYYDLIRAFYDLTGCPVVFNTSFNVRGEPIICDPRHAYTCFMRTEMDVLMCGPYLLRKDDQPKFEEEGDWRHEFELD